jgi:hypothetical protein
MLRAMITELAVEWLRSLAMTLPGRQAATIQSAEFRFVVIKGEFRRSLLRDFFVGYFDAEARSVGGSASHGTVFSYPEVAAFNSLGKRTVVEVGHTDEEYVTRMSEIDEDYRLLPLPQ